MRNSLATVPDDVPTIPPGWHWQSLASIVQEDRGISYGIVQPGDLDPTGVPILRADNVRDGYVHTNNVLRVDPKIEEKYSRTRLCGGEVLLTLVGAYFGKAAVAPAELRGWNVARAVAFIPVMRDIEPEWVAFALRSPIIQTYIQNWATTTAQPTLNLRDVGRIPIPLPPSNERHRLVQFLTSLDRKIELNRHINETLEAIARELFKSQFVDSASHQLSTVGDEFILTMGQSPPGETYNETGEGIPFFQGRTDFGFRYPEVRVYCAAPTRFAERGDTLVSVRAPVGDINMAKQRCCIGRGVAALRHGTGKRSYTYYSAKVLKQQLDIFEAEGTVFGSISKDQFNALKVIAPRPEAIERFELTANPIDDLIETNHEQSQTLIALREALLPKLISGEVRLIKAEQIIEAHA
jgi:type I restriction enzyme S subunit